MPAQWGVQLPQPNQVAGGWGLTPPDYGFGDASTMMSLAQAMGGIAGLVQSRAAEMAGHWESARARRG